MEGEKNILNNDKLLDSLFDYSNKEDDILYKNDIDLYPPLFEEDNIEEKFKKGNVEISRDKILQNLSLEEYSTFPQKNDSFIINVNEQGKEKEKGKEKKKEKEKEKGKEKEKEKEDQDKLLEDEIDYLQNLHKLNYLTFSPFGTSFFPNLCLNKIETEKEKNEEEQNKEKENKILNMIDFDYNNFEINNDLLFNICMGFIDMNKLKIENVITNENMEQSELKKKKMKKFLQNFQEEEKENENNKEISESEELNTSLMEEINTFIEENKEIPYYTEIINKFNNEFNDNEKSEDVNKENELLEKWKKIFENKKEDYKKYLRKEREKKKKEDEEEKIKKRVEEIEEQKRKEKIRKEEEFIRELEKIRMKGLKRNNQKKGKVKSNNNILNRGEIHRKRFLSSEPQKSYGFHAKWNKHLKKNNSYDKDDRYTYMKRNNYYFFQKL